MLSRIKTHVNPASVLALVALFVALGGVSYAAATIHGKNIKNGTITTKKLKNGTVTNAKVKKGSLKANRLSPGARAALKGDAGPQGAAGPQGPQGPQGAPGTAVAYAQVNDNPLGFVAQRTSGFAGLTRPSAGLYCLAPTASVADVAFDGAQPTRPTVASVEYGNTGTQTDTLIVEPRGGTFTCPGGTFEVRTYRNGALASDVAFTLIVP
ncbi:MAG: hypothetical protein GXY03_07315 [Solirubrobacterales bacterium]|mgnify:FL=1|nr:hypothetical protein [Solirubrobacterales bacterium]